jgi:hypothetical protein
VVATAAALPQPKPRVPSSKKEPPAAAVVKPGKAVSTARATVFFFEARNEIPIGCCKDLLEKPTETPIGMLRTR